MPVKEFASRRRQLMRMIGEESVAIVPAAPERLRNGDSFYRYRQDSDFWYLTGLGEPQALLLLAPGRGDGEQILFCRERDPDKERWDGARIGLEGAVSDYGMDRAHPFDKVDDLLPEMLAGRERIYYAVGRDPALDRRIMDWRGALGKARKHGRMPEELVSLEHLLHDMRLFKSRAELSAMRRAARISAKAHARAMQACRPGMSEADIHAELLHEFTRNGTEPAYLPIVAGGSNALILHYIDNNQRLPDGELLLIDAGCEYRGHASDITRTFPVNGRYSGPQREVYDIVLAAQAAAIEKIRPGRNWDEMHTAAVKVLVRGMLDLGLLTGDPDEVLETESYRRFYMHKTGHWLGLDVHDVGDYQVDNQPRVLEKGMVMTVEPGLYIGREDDIPEALRGIGVRIEDDVAVTVDEPEILSRDVPVGADEIEELMRTQKKRKKDLEKRKGWLAELRN